MAAPLQVLLPLCPSGPRKMKSTEGAYDFFGHHMLSIDSRLKLPGNISVENLVNVNFYRLKAINIRVSCWDSVKKKCAIGFFKSCV